MSPSCKVVDVDGGKDHSSDADVTGGVPPAAKADVVAFDPPAEPTSPLPVDKSFNSVHEVPFQDSVLALLDGPPNHKAEVYVPADPVLDLVVVISATSVQLEPSQDSTEESVGPTTIAAVDDVPAPDPPPFVEFVSVVSVHDEPFQVSTALLI